MINCSIIRPFNSFFVVVKLIYLNSPLKIEIIFFLKLLFTQTLLITLQSFFLNNQIKQQMNLIHAKESAGIIKKVIETIPFPF